MKDLSKEHFFFFDEGCSNIEIHPNSLEHAYLAILNDDLDAAEEVFSKTDSPRAKWGKIFVSILKGYMNFYPTYFEIRNFFEIDIDFLLKNNKINYVEQCLGALDIFASINQEVYKYTARVMLENKLYKAAEKYMEKSKQIYYNDPELHYMFAKYYTENLKYKDAYFYVNECLKFIPDYYPAQQLKEQIEQIGF